MSDLPQKFAGTLLFGVGEKLMRGSLLHYHAVRHENGLGGNIAGKAHLVGDNQHCLLYTSTYDPNKEPSEIKIDAEKAKQWIANGAQPTDTVRVLLKKSNVL